MRSRIDPFSSAFAFAITGALLYFGAALLCSVVLFGYEEQWIGQEDEFYTLSSMGPWEGAAYVTMRYVLTFPAWPPAWFGEFSGNWAVFFVSGALVWGIVGWLLGRHAAAAV